MKNIFLLIAWTSLFLPSYGKVQLYLGLHGGGGVMLTRDQLNNLATPPGYVNATRSTSGWSLHAKAEALIGFKRLRIGYQFLYNFSQPSISNSSYSTFINENQNATYFNNSRNNFFGHYFLAEYAIINSKHFALTPGLALGSFTGYKVDNNTGERVELSTDTHHRFSLGASLNIEIKFGRLVFLAGPNYYLFTLQDRTNHDWRESQQFIGGDIGLRFNLLKP